MRTNVVFHHRVTAARPRFAPAANLLYFNGAVPKTMTMKQPILLLLFSLSILLTKAQALTQLPPGKYETKFKTGAGKWEKGDVVLLDDTHYQLSNGGDAGEYKFSVAAQRIFFTSGPLKTAFTKVALVGNKPVIIFPAEENGSLGLKAEVWASKE